MNDGRCARARGFGHVRSAGLNRRVKKACLLAIIFGALAVSAVGCGETRSTKPPPPSKDHIANAFDVMARDLLEGRGEDAGVPMKVTCQRQANFDSCYAAAIEDPNSKFGSVRLTVLGHDCYRVEVFPPNFEYPNVL